MKKCMNPVGLIFEVSFSVTECFNLKIIFNVVKALGQVTITCLSIQARQQTVESHNFGKHMSS